MNKMFKSGSAVLLLSLLCTTAFSQPNDSSVFEAVTDTPVNAGIALMAIAGIGYGFKQLRKRRH